MHPTQPHNVLIVDDDHLIADTLTLIFTQAGYSSRAEYSAESALAVVSAWPPQLVITDISLQGMNGIELAKRLKETCPECRILFLSGHDTASNLLEADENIGHRWTILPKPTSPPKLLGKAAELLRVCAPE